MPIHYKVDFDKRLILSECYGEMSLADYIHHIANVRNKEEHYDFDEIIDARNADFSGFFVTDTLDILSQVASSPFVTENACLAIIVDSGQQLLTSDVYVKMKAFMNVDKMTTRTFSCPIEAREWIANKANKSCEVIE